MSPFEGESPYKLEAPKKHNVTLKLMHFIYVKEFQVGDKAFKKMKTNCLTNFV